MTESAIRAFAAARRFAPATVERWLVLPPADGARLLDIAEALRLGENQFRDVLDDLSAVAARHGSSLAAVADRPEVATVLTSGRGRNERLRALRAALRRLRYPELTAAEQRLVELRRALRLPAGVRLEWPENLEGEALTLILRGRSAAELRAQLAAAAAAVEPPEIEEMFAVLEGRW